VVLGPAGLNELSPKIWPEPIVFEPNQSYWAKSQPPQNPPLAEDITADVVVLGGGFTGPSVWKISSGSIRWGSKGPVLMSIHIPRKLIDDYGGAKPAGIAVSI
jgi:hypothetical protein